MGKWAIKTKLSINSATLKKHIKKQPLHAVDFDHPNLPSEQQDRKYHVSYQRDTHNGA